MSELETMPVAKGAGIQESLDRENEAFGTHYTHDSEKDSEGKTCGERNFEYLHSWLWQRLGERTLKVEEWDRQWAAYTNTIDDPRFFRETGANVKVPTIFEAINTSLVKIDEMMYPKPRWANIDALHPAYKSQSRQAEGAFDWNEKKMEWARERINTSLLALIHGYAPVWLAWETKQRRETWSPHDEPEQTKDRKPWEPRTKVKAKPAKIRTVFDEGARWNLLKPHDVYIQQGQNNPQTAPGGVMVKVKLSSRQCEILEARGVFEKGLCDKLRVKVDAKNPGPGAKTADGMDVTQAHQANWASQMNESGASFDGYNWDILTWECDSDRGRALSAGFAGDDISQMNALTVQEWGNSEFVCRWYWGPAPVYSTPKLDENGDETGEMEHKDGEWQECEVAMIGPFQARCVENTMGFRPINFMSNHELPHFSCGMGSATPILTLAQALNELYNLGIEVKALQAQPPLVIGAGAGVPTAKGGKFWIEGGMVIRARGNIQQLTWLPPPTDYGAGESGVAMLKGTTREVLGHTGAVLGQSGPGETTGTQAEIHRVASGGRFQIEAIRNEPFVNWLVRATVKYFQLFMGGTHWIQVVGEDGIMDSVLIDRSALLGDFIYTTNSGADMGNAALHFAQAQQLFTTFAPLAQVLPSIDLDSMARSLVQMSKIPGTREWVREAADPLATLYGPDRELRFLMAGGVVKPKPGPENIAYMQFYEMPMFDKQTQQPVMWVNPETQQQEPMNVGDWFIFGDHDISTEARANFKIVRDERSMLALQAQQQMQMEQMSAPQQPGMPPEQGGAPGPGRVPPQEMPRSEGGVESQVRSDAQTRATALEGDQSTGGMRGV